MHFITSFKSKQLPAEVESRILILLLKCSLVRDGNGPEIRLRIFRPDNRCRRRELFRRTLLRRPAADTALTPAVHYLGTTRENPRTLSTVRVQLLS